LTGSNTAPTVLNNGTIVSTGSLSVSTAIDPSSTGLFQLGNGSTFECAVDLGTQAQMMFIGNSRLVVDNTALFGINVGTASYVGPQLQDFVAGSTIDLMNLSFAGGALTFDSSTGILQISNIAHQVASLSFQTSSLGSGNFQMASDGASGVLITHS
jgi:hypothetical protein